MVLCLQEILFVQYSLFCIISGVFVISNFRLKWINHLEERRKENEEWLYNLLSCLEAGPMMGLG